MNLIVKTDVSEIQLLPEDTIDLEDEGLIVYFKEPLATAVRIFIKEQQRKIRETIKFVKSKESTNG